MLRSFVKHALYVLQQIKLITNLENFFRTTVGVLFNIFLENIMLETLQDFNTTISIGGRPICIFVLWTILTS